MSRTEEMRRLVTKLQTDRSARVADVATMQMQTAAYLGDVRTEQCAVADATRAEMAAERVKRSEEREQMATATATFRADVRTQQQMVFQQLHNNLTHQRLLIAQQAAHMSTATAAFRTSVIAANAAMADQVRRQMDADRQQLMAATAEFLQNAATAQAAMSESLHSALAASRAHTRQVRQTMSASNAAFLLQTKGDNKRMALQRRMQLDKGSEELADAVVQMLSDMDVYVETLRQANQALAVEVHRTLDAERATRSAETAQFRSQTRTDHAAMAAALRKDLAEAQSALLEARAAMSEQIAEFRANIRTANEATAQELHRQLAADRAELAASTDKMMAGIDAFLAEIQQDAAGAAEAWLLVKQMSAAEAAPEAPAAPAAQQMAEVPAVAPMTPSDAPDSLPDSLPDSDPLIEINGIGPSTQERLYEAGIKTFAQLAGMHPDALRTAAGSAVTRRYDVEDWIEEARQRRSE